MQITTVKINNDIRKTNSYVVKINNEDICQLNRIPKNWLCGDKRFVYDLIFFKNSYDLKYYFNKSRSIKEIINFIERELNNK